MIVITIGRSHDNDIRINDPYVGRHHCQIVQHNNGSVTVVDMNSTNGTFVNGRRIIGEVKLQPYDSITIGTTNLPWMSYLPPEPPITKSYALPIVLGGVGGVIMTILLALLIFRHGSDKTFDFKGEYPDAVVVNMVNEEGTPYTIEAIEGQVCVWFKNGVPYNTAKQCIKASDGRIVAQDPGNGYYLVKVPADKVNVFLDRIKKESSVDWAYPNMISYSCAVHNFVLDNYYPDTRYSKQQDNVPHGRIVEYALREYGSNIELRHFNIGNENGYNMCTSKKLASGCTNKEYFAIDSISRLNNDGPIFINMSYGPGLPRRNKPNGDPEKYYWKNATNKEKETYQIWYLESLKKTIKNLRTINGKDYVVVVAAGNEGVKAFGDSIIAFIRNSSSFTEYEKGIMDKHFLLVTAGETEDENKHYSNEMESGHYDPWVTKMDISDFKYSDGIKRRGTSFAAPRTAGILSSVANEMNLTGAEVLKLAREVTKRDGELTKNALLQAVNNKPSPNADATIRVIRTAQKQKQSKNTTNIVGSMWRHDFSHNPDIELYDTLRFDDESNGTALQISDGESSVISHFHYYYDDAYNGWCITDWGKNTHYFVINGNELNLGYYKPCVLNGKNIVFDSRCYHRM